MQLTLLHFARTLYCVWYSVLNTVLFLHSSNPEMRLECLLVPEMDIYYVPEAQGI